MLSEFKYLFFEFALGYFSESLGAVSEEQGELFNQEIKEMERRFQGRWNVNMMCDYCWTLHREMLETPQRKSNIRSFAGKRKRQYKAIE
jgi:hypothetical protein